MTEVAKDQEPGDENDGAGAGLRAAPPPDCDDQKVQAEADREVVETEVKQDVVSEWKGEERVRPSLLAGVHPDGGEKEKHNTAGQDLLRNKRRYDRHQERHDHAGDPVRMRTPVDAIGMLDGRIASPQQLAPQPGVVHMP